MITGAGAGIGAATAKAFAAAGYSVAVADVDVEAARGVASSLETAAAYEVDVRSRASIERACAEAVRGLGPLKVWVSSAGVSTMAHFLDLTDEEIDWNLDVNLRGTLIAGQVAARQMVSQGGGGAIVNVASMAGKRGGVPLLAHYIAAKFGVVGLTQAMACELAPQDIRVNSVCPGYVDTGMQDREIGWEGELLGLTREQVIANHRDDTPQRREQTPEEIAALILFLASDSAASITGESVAINGGSYMD
jgi:meso-butanediol dehydrogenase / (S,S)-butanediol dehydrogenase / diacetyl reductase